MEIDKVELLKKKNKFSVRNSKNLAKHTTTAKLEDNIKDFIFDCGTCPKCREDGIRSPYNYTSIFNFLDHFKLKHEHIYKLPKDTFIDSQTIDIKFNKISKIDFQNKYKYGKIPNNIKINSSNNNNNNSNKLSQIKKATRHDILRVHCEECNMNLTNYMDLISHKMGPVCTGAKAKKYWKPYPIMYCVKCSILNKARNNFSTV